MGEELLFTYDITYTFIFTFLILLVYGLFCRWLGYRSGFKKALKEFDLFPVWIRDNFHIREKEGHVCWESWRDRKMPDSTGNSKDAS